MKEEWVYVCVIYIFPHMLFTWYCKLTPATSTEITSSDQQVCNMKFDEQCSSVNLRNVGVHPVILGCVYSAPLSYRRNAVLFLYHHIAQSQPTTERSS